LNGDTDEQHRQSLAYEPKRRPYVPPYYPQPGEGLLSSAAKLAIVVGTLTVGGLFVAAAAVFGLRRFSMTAVVVVAIGALLMACGIRLGRSTIRPVARRWKAWRQREP
jgi:VIT1/CCC1 family predicted Fe2+/Mn2+ transporter